jgi:hypothetical protein
VPVARYFVFIGGALAALLLITSWWLSEPRAMSAARPQIIATAAIRIKSERKWPEKIEFDTSQPTIVPPVGEASSVTAPPAPPPPGEKWSKPGLAALAQLKADTRLTATQHHAAPVKRRLAATGRSRRVGRVAVADRLGGFDGGEACCRSGWANDWQGGPDRMSRRHAAPSWPTSWLAFSQR